MTAPTINGRGMLRARIVLPLRGVWYADVQVDAEDEDLDALAGDVELDFGEVTLAGRALRSGTDHGRVELEVAGGAAGMETTLEPRYYADAPVGIILRDLARETGETLADDIASDVTSHVLARWTRAGGRAGDAMAELARALDLAWRVRPDGRLWIGDETWPDTALDEYDLLVDVPSRNRQQLGVDGPVLVPGTLLDGRRVSHVVHTIEPSTYRTEVWFDPDESQNPDDVTLRPLLDAYSGAWRRQDRTALYPGRVVSQAADLSLEVQFDDARWPSMTKVPLRTFVPGAIVEVAAGARVLVGWEEARPDKPYAMLFDGGTLSKLSIVSSDLRLGGDGATAAAAKAPPCDSQFDSINAAIDAFVAAVPSANDGGATLQAAVQAVWGTGTPPKASSDVGAVKVKVE